MGSLSSGEAFVGAAAGTIPFNARPIAPVATAVYRAAGVVGWRPVLWLRRPAMASPSTGDTNRAARFIATSGRRELLGPECLGRRDPNKGGNCDATRSRSSYGLCG